MAKATVITVQLSPWPTHPFAGPGSTLLSLSSLVAGSSLNSTQQHWDSIEAGVVFVITYAVPGRNYTHNKQTVFYFMLLLGLGLAHGAANSFATAANTQIRESPGTMAMAIKHIAATIDKEGCTPPPPNSHPWV
jgi:hypothetical protein